MMSAAHRRRVIAFALSLLPSVALAGGGSAGSWWENGGAAACLHCRLEAGLAGSRRFDASSGRDLLNYPRHRVADFLHMKLAIDIADMNTPRAEATQTLTLRPIARNLSRLSLDAPLLEISAVTPEAAGEAGACRVSSFSHDGEQLVIEIDPPLPVGVEGTLTIVYTINDPPEGLIWTPESPAWPGRPAQLHTQGQPQSNRYWFPCHDFPNERMSTELVVTVPRGFTASSNGRLVSHERRGDRETFHWLQEKDHVSYLVTLVVGKFEVVDVGTRALPMPVYAPIGLGDRVHQTYGRTGEMVELFAKLVDEPYPWDRYAQLVVHNFMAGGMENTSATTMFDTAVLDRTALADGDLEGLISHELAHQWFGDLLTCRSWEHIWLNEGFATYFTNLWWEHRDGPEGYQAGVRGNFRAVIDGDTGSAPESPGMVSKEYGHPWEVFRRAANPYPKGASILHMLRMKLGDEAFFKGLALYVDRHKQGLVETGDLRRALEHVSGLSLQRFFEQWCYRPGIPRLNVTLRWDSAASELVATVEQTQTIDGANPAFAIDLPIWVRTPGARVWERLTLSTDERTATARFKLAAEPAVVAVDPEMHVLAGLTIDQPEPRWIAQLRDGPTLAARMQAAEALGRSESLSPEAVRALLAVARSDRLARDLRTAAIAALAGNAALAELIASPPTDPRVRCALIERAPSLCAEGADPARAETTRGFLLRAAREEGSYAARAAALRALAQAKHPEALAVLREACGVDSQHDQIRQAALDGLAQLDVPEALPLAMRLTAPGVASHTRAAAAEAVGRLGHHDPDAAVELLARLTGDREARTVRAAGQALVTIGQERCRAALEAYAARARSAIERDQAARWLEELSAKLAAAGK